MALQITQLPTPAPTRTDPNNFPARGDALVAALPAFVTQTNAVATEMETNRALTQTGATTATAQATAAAVSATAAQQSAVVAASAAGSAIWVSATTYAVGAVVYSPLTLLTYRRRTAGAGTTDPSLDPTNWDLVAAAAPPVIVVTAASVSAAANGHYVLVGAVQQTVTLPSTPAVGEIVVVTVANDRSDARVGRNGNSIMGLTEDLDIDSRFATVTLRWVGAGAGGWRLV